MLYIIKVMENSICHIALDEASPVNKEIPCQARNDGKEINKVFLEFLLTIFYFI